MSDMDQTPAEALDYEPDLITLLDEDGKEHEFEVLDTAVIGDVRYMALVEYEPGAENAESAEADEEETEMLIMRVSEEDGEEFLDLVDGEDELFTAGQVFMNRLEELYDIDLKEFGIGE